MCINKARLFYGFFCLFACFSFLCCLFEFPFLFVCSFWFQFWFLKLRYFALALNFQIRFRPTYPLVILLWQVMLIKCPKHGVSGALWINFSILFTLSVLCNVNAQVCKVCHATCAVLLDINTVLFLLSCLDIPQMTPEKIYLQKAPLLWQRGRLKCCKQGPERRYSNKKR